MTADRVHAPLLLVTAIAALGLTAVNCSRARPVATTSPPVASSRAPMLVPIASYSPWGSSVELRPSYASWFGVSHDDVGAVFLGVVSDTAGAPLTDARVAIDQQRTQVVYLEERDGGLAVRAESSTGALGLFAVRFFSAQLRDAWWNYEPIGMTLKARGASARFSTILGEAPKSGIPTEVHKAIIDRIMELWFRPYRTSSS